LLSVEEVIDPMQIFYTEQDHIDSSIGLYTERGQGVYAQNFDAWVDGALEKCTVYIFSERASLQGEAVYLETWQYTSSSTTKPEWLIRGYTGHEMLPEFGLVNMNGRMYDPVLGRMLSPDKFVHDAAGTQGFNRYSYVLNNPLSYVDPDGNVPIPIILKGIVKGVSKFAGKKLAVGKVKAKKAYAAVKKFPQKKSFAHTISGINNSLNQTEWDDAGFGWEALGHFAAGYIGSSMGLRDKELFAKAISVAVSGGLTVVINEARGDHEDEYDILQSFIGGGLSTLVGMNLSKNLAKNTALQEVAASKAKKFWKQWYGKGTKSALEGYAAFFAYDKEDKFLKTPWYAHIGVAATSFAVGSGINLFEKNDDRIFFKMGINESPFLKYSTNALVRLLGVTLEYRSTKEFKSLNLKDYGKKTGKSVPKLLGYLLTTYY
jgi:RHS repeat-associated protein